MDTLKKFKQKLNDIGLDAALITSEVSTSYLTSFPGLCATLLICKNGKSFCLTDSRYEEEAQIKLTSLGYTVLIPENGGVYREISKLCGENGVKTLGYESAFVTVDDFNKLSNNISLEYKSVSDILSDMRASKLPFEVENIIKAQRIAEKSLDTLLGEIKPGMTENECKARLEYLMAKEGSEKPSFDTIFISGSKTSMPHGTPDNKIICKGEFITVDFGAVVSGYRSDMTRTFSLSKPTEQMKKVYDTVLTAQKAGCEAAFAGKMGREIDKAARDIIENAGYGKNFGHSLGHGVGLMIHEKPSASPLSKDIIPVNTVLTIEPGIYLPGLFGVRIEDMMYLTEKENINLTKFTKNLIII